MGRGTASFYVGMTRAKDRLSLVCFRKAELPSAFAQELLGPVTLPQLVKRILRPCPKPAATVFRSVERRRRTISPACRCVTALWQGTGGSEKRRRHCGVVSGWGRRKLSLTAALPAGQLQME